jgi:ubiquinone/menaquinone biosynthesis C-methylase UbiE
MIHADHLQWQRARLLSMVFPSKGDSYHMDKRNHQTVAARYQNRREAEVYDRQRYYGVIDRYKNWWLRRSLKKILEMLPPNSIVLDIPCGTGRIDNWLLQSSVRVVAADISNEMISVARPKVKPTRLWLGFVRAEAAHLPFRMKSFDCVFSIRFFHLLDQQTRLTVLREMAQTTTRWIVVESRRIQSYAKAVKRALMRVLLGRVERPRWSLQQTVDELGKCGFMVEEYYYHNRWFSGIVLIRASLKESQKVKTGNNSQTIRHRDRKKLP